MSDLHIIAIRRAQFNCRINTGVFGQLRQVSVVLLKADILSQAQLVQLLDYVLHILN